MTEILYRPYTPIRRRRRDGFEAIKAEVTLMSRVASKDYDNVLEWLQDKRVYLPFGFPRPFRRRYIERSMAPNGSGAMQPVDLLMAKSKAPAEADILAICWEGRRRPCDGCIPMQEIDLAVRYKDERTSPNDHDRTKLIFSIRRLLYAYLFAWCGARVVTWERRKIDEKQVRACLRPKNRKPRDSVYFGRMLSQSSEKDVPIITWSAAA